MTNKENKVSIDQATAILKEYAELKRKRLQLEFEINNSIYEVTGKDMIDALTFKRTFGESAKGGQVSDKASNIALSYAEEARNLNLNAKQELVYEMRLINMEMDRIEFYINLLEWKHAEALKLLYLGSLTFIEAAQKLGIAITSLKHRKNVGIKWFAEMLSLVVKYALNLIQTMT